MVFPLGGSDNKSSEYYTLWGIISFAGLANLEESVKSGLGNLGESVKIGQTNLGESVKMGLENFWGE